MVYEKILNGKTVHLRSVNIEDAEFTLNIRNNPELTIYIPKVSINIEEQCLWIENQRKKEGDYFFLILDKDKNKLGTISIYNVGDKTAESGRFLSIGNSIQNMESLVLTYDFAFFSLNVNILNFEVYKENKKIVNMWKRLGSQITSEKIVNGFDSFCFELTKTGYEETFRPKIVDTLNRCI